MQRHSIVAQDEPSQFITLYIVFAISTRLIGKGAIDFSGTPIPNINIDLIQSLQDGKLSNVYPEDDHYPHVIDALVYLIKTKHLSIDQIDYDKLPYLPFALPRAISRGASDEGGFPAATLNRATGALRVTSEASDKDAFLAYSSLAKLLPFLAEKYGIRLLPGTHEYATFKTSPIDPNYHVYEFNISPVEFDNLLLHISENYTGYRNTNAGASGSLLTLANPNQILMKDKFICLFPAQDLGNNTAVMRSAGCNTTEVSSTQLAFLISKYIPEMIPTSTDGISNQYFGHHNAPLVEQVLHVDNNILNTAICNCTGLDSRYTHHENTDGTTSLALNANTPAKLVDMTPNAQLIYRTLGVVTTDELALLKSVEVPVEHFLNQIIDTLRNRIAMDKTAYETAATNIAKGVAKFDDEYTFKKAPEMIKELEAGLKNITLILSKIAHENNLALGVPANASAATIFTHPAPPTTLAQEHVDNATAPGPSTSEKR